MGRRIPLLLGALALIGPTHAKASEPNTAPVRVVVIPVRDEITEPEFYIIRRG